MNLSIFTARKIASNKGATFSKFIIRLATIGTALSVAVMILAVGLVKGFQKNIEHKLLVFWDDFQISTADPTGMVGTEKMQIDEELERNVKAIPEVKKINPFVLKAGIIKGNGPVHGIKLKGVRNDFPFESNNSITYEGKAIDFSDSAYSTEVILSAEVINRLELTIGDYVIAYFLEEGSSDVRKRQLHLVGSFHTGVGEIDNTFAYCDLRMLQRLNKWDDQQISGYQVALTDYEFADSIADFVYQEYVEPPVTTETVKNIYPGIFSWINVQDVNARVLLIIMSIVAIINISTALLIFILERTQMIGILKALGMSNWRIQKVFLMHATLISIRGILIGNAIAMVLSFLQIKYKFITLDESVYYMKYAPIEWSWWSLLFINLGTLLLCFILMIIPSWIVRKVNIVKAIRFN